MRFKRSRWKSQTTNTKMPSNVPWASLLLLPLLFHQASAVTLSDFSPYSTNLTSSCSTVYTLPIPGCTNADFLHSDPCTSTCYNGLVEIQREVVYWCAHYAVDDQNLIAQFLEGNGPNILCPQVISPYPSSSNPIRPTTTQRVSPNKHPSPSPYAARSKISHSLKQPPHPTHHHNSPIHSTSSHKNDRNKPTSLIIDTSSHRTKPVPYHPRTTKASTLSPISHSKHVHQPHTSTHRPDHTHKSSAHSKINTKSQHYSPSWSHHSPSQATNPARTSESKEKESATEASVAAATTTAGCVAGGGTPFTYCYPDDNDSTSNAVSLKQGRSIFSPTTTVVFIMLIVSTCVLNLL